ncbi:MAG: hypothetical protein JW751_08170 [Polyangiaceae bacterium]|nr:hypothetical protein [Polyangiaceae bacterium]
MALLVSSRRAATLLAGALLVAVAACSKPGLQGQTYRDQEVAFRVGAVPSTWRPIELDQTRLAFRDDESRATIAVNGRCGQDGDDVPLTALTQHLFLVFTDRSLLSQEKLALDGRAALHTVVTARLDGVERRFSVYVLKKDGCVYDFLFIADPSTDTSAFAAFDRFVRGFTTIE